MVCTWITAVEVWYLANLVLTFVHIEININPLKIILIKPF